MIKNIIDKIWDAHVVCSEPNTPDVFFIDKQLLHEVTTPQAFQIIREKNLTLLEQERNIATIDHSIPTDPERKNYPDDNSRIQVETMRRNVNEFGIKLYDVGSGNQGIVHIIGPELGFIHPGDTIVCGDSHTSTHGAFGAIAFGIGTTQILHVLTTRCLLLEKPLTMKVHFQGNPTEYFSPKDAILALIQQIGIQGGTGYLIEYTGEYIRSLDMEGRMTICNMSIECGAKAGLVSPDQITFDFLQNKEYTPLDFEDTVDTWKKLASPDNAYYDKEIVVNLENLKSFVTWGTNPEQSLQIHETIPFPQDFINKDTSKVLATQKSLDYTKLSSGNSLIGTKIDYVFVGSCTNGRINDFRIVAKILQGKKIYPDIKAFFVPGSELVRKQCIEEGLDQIFIKSGAKFLMSGCSMCLAMNGDLVPAGKRCASTSNRNFVGRQGTGSFTHLMSPLMASLCALTGEICDPDKFSF